MNPITPSSIDPFFSVKPQRGGGGRGQRPPRDAWEEAVLERLQHITQGLTYRDISRLTSVHPETVRRYLVHGRPTAFFIAAICRSLGISALWVLYGEGEKPDISYTPSEQAMARK